ncbi:ATPase RavA (Regulatory ATPase variant A) [Durusdinium trenchii]|uniref:ATPase RavA (Regulatory ATPase variant A) n=1 Tax=Durusdinium trenchii TaxID=1381693 RepID=A0ABP0R2M6_9DINO
MLRFRGHGVSTEDATILRGMGRLASERGPWRSGWARNSRSLQGASPQMGVLPTSAGCISIFCSYASRRCLLSQRQFRLAKVKGGKTKEAAPDYTTVAIQTDENQVWGEYASSSWIEFKRTGTQKFFIQDDLIVVVQNADKEAQELCTTQIGTDALLLSLLTVSEEDSPNADATRKAAFPGISTEQVASYLQQRSQKGAKGKKASGATSKVPMMFTPMTRRSLQAAQEEQVRLGHAAVEPAHLLLALLKEQRAQSNELLQHFGQSPEDVQRRVLATLQGPLAKVRLDASITLLELEKEVVADAAPASDRPLATKLSKAYTQLTGGLVERSVEAKLMLLAALSGEHLFLLGPPGTAKSLLARRLAEVCRGKFFERLLTRFSVPEEVFGPLSLQALEKDELRRKVEGFLPTADVAFLDEIFKANSSILNALLTLLNERRFDNGVERIEVPLWCAVAASNELPESDELEALFDRFLLRRAVPRVSDREVPEFLKRSLEVDAEQSDDNEEEGPMLSVVDSVECQSLALKTVFPSDLLDLVVSLRAYLRDEAEPPVLLSDRRLKKAVRLIRLAAFTAGAEEVSELDLLLLQHMCWDKEPSQAGEVRVWLLERMRKPPEREDVVKKAGFILKGLKLRLRRNVRGSSLDLAKKDLSSLREVLQEQLQRRLRRRANLQAMLQNEEGLRLFWLEKEDLSEAKDLLLPALEEDVSEASVALKEVLELQGATELTTEAREMTLDSLLEDEGMAQESLSTEKMLKMPLNGTFPGPMVGG